tara:strand:+ start:1923 stop:6149 length:4227 start_codon:yes stop_codon:yes gene_type:complete
MAKVSNNFIKGRMNKDLDDRLIPNGEYRNAMNAQVSKSEGENVGALENTLGNIKISDFRALTTITDLVSIGYFADEINNRVYIFLTNNDTINFQPTGGAKSKHYIYVYNTLTTNINQLVTGSFLNFSTQFPVTAVNLLEDLLFWSDNRNQPRKINVELAIANDSSATKPYYTFEDQISVAKYNPYQTIDLYRVSPNTADSYETTMYDVTSKAYPDGGTGKIDGTLSPAGSTIDLLSGTITGDVIPGATIAYINPTTGFLIPTTATVSTFDYSQGSGNNPPTSRLTTSSNIGPFSTNDVELVFNYNNYYEGDFNGDKDFLKDKFVRFSYRYKFVDGEYSIFAPFTQPCFIPKKDGYFMYKVNQFTSTLPNYRTSPPPLDIQDEEDTYRSTIVEFMENKVDKIILRIPLPYSSANFQRYLNVEEIEILYKESDSLAVNVIESVPVSKIANQTTTARTNSGGTQSGTSLVIDTISASGNIQVGATVTGTGIVNNPTVVSFNGVDTVVLSITQSNIANDTLLTFNDVNYFEYQYQSTKPYKVLPDNEITRTYDKVPVKALAQEIISNRVVYGNFQDKHNPPSTIDYNVAVSQKTSFSLGTGSTTTTAIEASGQTVLSVATPSGVYNNGAIVTSPVAGIPANTTLVNYDGAAATITISKALTSSLPSGTAINFAAPNSVRYTTSYIEYPNHSLKQKRNYQVGVVLSDRWGRTSTVILSDTDNSVKYENERYFGSTVFADYLSSAINKRTWPGNSLKVLFNSPISGSTTGLYNGDSTSADYNPLGWYSYKIVVKQTEQEYYNVYLPGVMASYPEDNIKELGKTSHAVLINDNINKVPRDLTEVGPEQRQFRSSVVLHGRVENLNSSLPADNNTQYYPGALPPVVSVIATDNDLFDGANEPDYVPSAEFYNVDSDPLIARINTPSKQFGIPSVLTSALLDNPYTSPAVNKIDINPSTLIPVDGNNAMNVIKVGQEVIGPGILPDTTVVSALTSGIITLSKDVDVAGLSTGSGAERYTFAPTALCSDPPNCRGNIYINMPQLAVMETDGVDSNLDIFWETTSTGLISDLNQAILNDTQSTANLSSFNATNFKESIDSNASNVADRRILAANFTLQDEFGNDINYINQTPAQVQLVSVTDLANPPLDVGPGSSNPRFELEVITSTVGAPGVYNIRALDNFYYSYQNNTKDTYSFTFELNINGVQTFITKTPIALINEPPTILANRCENKTYVVGSDGGGVGTIIALPGFNGSFSLSDKHKDLTWSLSVIKSGVQYGPSGNNYVRIDQQQSGDSWTGRIYFNGGDPPNDMEDGVYTCIATLEDAGAETVTCNFTLTIQRDPCYTWRYTYQNTGNTVTGAFTTCDGVDEGVISFVDTASSSVYNYQCARDTTYTQNNIGTGWTKLALNNTDPFNSCNGG